MDERLQQALTAVELREAELLSWGAVGAQWHRDELLAVLEQHGPGEGLLRELMDRALIVETPLNGYRTRSAETIRMLATLRQAFRNESILGGRPLVLDYRYLQRPRRRPVRSTPVDDLLATASVVLGPDGLSALQLLTPTRVSAFQHRSVDRILSALDSGEGAGIMVSAGTGSGKTLAFYLPLFAWICDQAPRASGVTALALYPRNELLKDQLRVLVAYALELDGLANKVAPVSLATWFRNTPESAWYVRQGWADSWKKTTGGYLCPFLRCPNPSCFEGDLIWPAEALSGGDELLRCVKCGLVIPGHILRLTRSSARQDPPAVMLSTTESLNRQLASPGNLRAFGIARGGLQAVLLDEVHTYEGTTGAQNAYLLRRLRKALGSEPIWAGLSATLTDGGEFFGRLVGVDPGKVTVVEPVPSELEESGAEYLVALRHNPHGSTGTLSTTIQAAMAMSRVLDPMTSNPFNPPIDSGGVAGNRLFTFTDKLDSTNRLYWDLLSAEGWDWPGRPQQGSTPLTLAHLRAPEQSRLQTARRESPEQRDMSGQNWWLAESLGHEIEGDVQKKISRTSSQDAGVASDADIVIATASLEVGFDDDRVGAVLQHKAPHDVAQFLQRKGRAGRNPSTRPWTVVVLSDWGRDRNAWDAYDALFSPVVPARQLPLTNLYVLRIQAVYSLLDWLASTLGYERGGSWVDATGPADLLTDKPKQQAETLSRQQKMANLLGALLSDGSERDRLTRHLRRSLSLGVGAAADRTLDRILWEAPRPLLSVVVPTLRRRLLDQWKGERPSSDDAGLRTRTPLRDFVPGNLFDELLVPEVEFRVPWTRGEIHTEYLPALRCLREFLPGNVSRHFGVWASNKRHWVPLSNVIGDDGSHIVNVATYGGQSLDTVATPQGAVRVFTPCHVDLQPVPGEVSDASSMRADWNFYATPLGTGVPLPRSGFVADSLHELTVHLHSQGDGLRVVRYAQEARGTLWEQGRMNPTSVRFVTGTDDALEAAALGVEIYVDAIVGRVALPEFGECPSPLERSEWLRTLITGDENLSPNITDFERSDLADCTEVVGALWDWSGQEPSIDDFERLLLRAGEGLGLHNPQQPGAFSAHLADRQTVSALRAHVLSARQSERSMQWLEWLQAKFTIAAAQALLGALTSNGSDVDVDQLLIDLDAADPGTFYISESSPGGTGQVESVSLDLIENPERLPSLIDDAISPSDLELMDDQMCAVVNHSESSIESAIAHLSLSWRQGHQAVREATTGVDDAVAAEGLLLGHPAKTAMATRIAGPGARPDFVQELREWLRTRQATEENSGMAVEPRTLAVLLDDRGDVDRFLHLTDPSRPQRSRAIANVLWPWGRSARPAGSFNPYAPPIDPAVDHLRAAWKSPIRTFDIQHWNAEVRDEVHSLLRDGGELFLASDVVARRTLRTALLDLETIPIEVGPLWCYPEITGVQDRGSQTRVRLILREAW